MRRNLRDTAFLDIIIRIEKGAMLKAFENFEKGKISYYLPQ